MIEMENGQQSPNGDKERVQHTHVISRQNHPWNTAKHADNTGKTAQNMALHA